MDELRPAGLFAPAKWHAQASCRGRGEMMFEPLDRDWTEAEIDAAKAVCADCPARIICLEYAIDEEIPCGIWGGLTWEERIRICPVCGWPKRKPDDLACCDAHDLLRMARLREQEAEGNLDVEVSLRQLPTARTYKFCPTLRGRSHSSARAYREGCKCPPARKALIDERRERRALARQTQQEASA